MNRQSRYTQRIAWWLQRNSPNIVGACVAGVIGAVCALVFAGWWVGA